MSSNLLVLLLFACPHEPAKVPLRILEKFFRRVELRKLTRVKDHDAIII
jgi:hypothetical protein